MPIHGITGVPGHGKTSLMMELLAAALAANEAAVKSGKPVFELHGEPMLERPIWVSGIDGLADHILERVHVLPDATRWNEAVDGDWCDCNNGTHQVLIREGFRPDGSVEDKKRWDEEMGAKRKHGHLVPDGAILFVDEAWGPFGHLTDARGRAVPLHVLALAEHRHRAIDMVWTFQGPSQMYPFARPLMAPHWHTVRLGGSQLIDVYKWNEFVEDVKSQGMRDRAEKATRTLPRAQRSWYKSASGHTMKTRIPRKLLLGAGAALVAIPLLVFGVNKMRPSEIAALGTGKAPETGLPVDGASNGGGPHKSEKSKEDEPLTVDEWKARFVPRIAGLPESAPVFDDRKVSALPRTFCVISAAWEGRPDSCRCVTEQLTRISDVSDGACRDWAAHGRYDFFAQPPSESRSPGAGAGPAGPAVTVLEEVLRRNVEGVNLAPSEVAPEPARPAQPGVLNPNMRPLPAAGG